MGKSNETPYGVKWVNKDSTTGEKWFASPGERASFVAKKRLEPGVKQNKFSLMGKRK